MQFVDRARDSRLRRDRALRARRRRAGDPQAARHRRRAAAAPRSAGADPSGSRAIPGIRRSGADHQRRAAARARRSRCTTPVCGGSTSTSIRSIASAFEQITRRDDLRQRAGRHRRGASGSASAIKLNAVAVKNLVEPDIVPLARFARENGFEVRYIEFMPLDAQNLWDRGKVLLADEMIEMLSREICAAEPVPDPDPRAPATEYALRGRRRHGGLHRLGEPAVLPELQSRPPDGGRQAALLPVRDRGRRREDAAALRRIGRRDRRAGARATSPASGSATRSTPRSSSRRRGPCTRSAADRLFAVGTPVAFPVCVTDPATSAS